LANGEHERLPKLVGDLVERHVDVIVAAATPASRAAKAVTNRAGENRCPPVLPVETEEQKAVARQLSPGRVFDNGRAFTPFARREVFSKVVEFAEGPEASTSSMASAANENASKVQDASAQTSGGASMRVLAPKSPEDWDQIGVGSLVLAEDDPNGWWECIVIGENGADVTLKWRDWKGYPNFVRRRTELALLPPGQH
jgi:hypothetical protein